jgi:hypothetical protein
MQSEKDKIPKNLKGVRWSVSDIFKERIYLEEERISVYE